MKIEDKVKKLIAEKLDLDSEDVKAITDKTTFEFLKADELDIIEIIMDCEKEFNIIFTVKEDTKIAGTENATVRDLIEIIKSHLQNTNKVNNASDSKE